MCLKNSHFNIVVIINRTYYLQDLIS